MRKQDHEIHGHELYNAFKRNPIDNDGKYILFIVIPIAFVVAFTIVVGPDRFIDVMSDFIVAIRN